MRRTVLLSISGLLLCGGVALAQTGSRSFHLSGATLRASLDSLMVWFPVSIVYLDRDVEGKTVTASCSSCTFSEALERVLAGSMLSWVRVGNQTILRARPLEESLSRATLSGLITDRETGTGIAGASVILRDSSAGVLRLCSTNDFGFYSLRRIPPGRYDLTIRALGYQVRALSLTLEGSLRQDVALAGEMITLEEVTVEGERTALSVAGGVARGIYVRSTPSDQNQYLLDGARVYNPSHYGGVLSTFNAEALNDVEALEGGLPPSYGGRIGGIVDLVMRDGSRERLAGSASSSVLGSELSLEGPLSSSTTALAAARRSYPDPALSFSGSETPSRLGSSEVTAKLSNRLSANSRLFLSGYWGSDAYDNLVQPGPSELSNNFSWRNGELSLQWYGIVSSSLFLRASAAYTRYDFALEHLLSGDPALSTGALSSSYQIEDVSLRAQAEHYYDEEHTFRGGVELTHHRMGGGISAFSTQLAPLDLEGYSSWDLAIFLQDEWRILPALDAALGFRASSFSSSTGSFSGIDPRFSLRYSLKERTFLYASITSINQYIHPYRNSGVFLLYPTIFFYPSGENVKPSTSLQATLGLKTGGESEFSLETFYRVSENLHEFAFDTTSPPRGDLREDLLLGTGWNYGLLLSLRKRAGDWTGSATYVLSWARNRIPGIEGGELYAPWYDRRHELQLESSFSAGRGWFLRMLAVLASPQSPPEVSVVRASALPNEGVNAAFERYIDINGSRLPGFQRLEATILKRVTLGNFPCEFWIRFLNAYGLEDPYVWTLKGSGDLRFRWNAELRDLRLFPLYPTAGFSVKF